MKNRWTLRFVPRVIKLPSSKVYWFEEADLLFVEPAKAPARLPARSARAVVPLDLMEIQYAIEKADAKEAYAFFRALGVRLLAICEQLVCPFCGELGEFRTIGGERRLVCERCKITWRPRPAQAEQTAALAENTEALPKSTLY